MDLSEALRLHPGDVVAFIGAGGKTGCIRRIMQERPEQTLILATTTTNLAKTEAVLATRHYVIHSAEDLDQAILALEDVGGALFTGPLNTQGDKWTGLDGKYITRLAGYNSTSGGVLLIEADGARGRMIKAPAEHEPVIPAEATVVVSVMRVDALGKHLVDEVVHRPQRVAQLLGVEEGVSLTIDHLASLIRHAEGGMKNIPEHAVVRIFVNGVDTEESKTNAQALASILQSEARISSVILGSLLKDDPVLAVWGRTGVVILAAGGSSRFGAPKLSANWKGKPILRHVVEMVLASDIDPAVVVLGAAFDQLSMIISDLPIQILNNPNWEDGQSTSLKIGLQALEEGCEAVIFVLGDMPKVDQSVLDALVEAHRMTLRSVVAPYAVERWGNPVLFDQRTFGDLLSLEGDRGGRALFDRYPPYAVPTDDGVLLDIDTPDDLDIDP